MRFTIALVSKAKLVSIVPYWKVSAESVKLRKQVEELFEKQWFNRSVSL